MLEAPRFKRLWMIQSREYFRTDTVNKRTTPINRKPPIPPPRKFSVEQAGLIRSQYNSSNGKFSYRDLAREWNCCIRCINHVVRRWGAYKNDPL